MPKIIKLDQYLANQISAGEVVERPVSVVKELVENSIDAGASEIKIEILGGGIKEIIVSDNGEGIEKDDLLLATEKYTTSKIKNLEDLYNVMTFGFRGEAISSVSSVSDFQMISKTKNSKFGYSLYLGNSGKPELKEIAIENGTKTIVKNLFSNTPARLNYLKKEKTEYAHIHDFLNQIALSYPNTGFEFISEGKKVFKYRSKENLKNRIYSIYGNEFAQNLLFLDFETIGIKLTGFISDPKVSFTNKNKQSLFVNRRIIRSPLIYKSVSNAYNRFIPHNHFASYVLNLEVDPTQIDVNVHPRKLEIRFADESSIFRSVYNATENRLNGVSLINQNTLLNLEKQSSTILPLNQYPKQKETSLDEEKKMNSSFSEILPSPKFSLKGEGIEYQEIGQNEKKEKFYTGSGTKFKSYSPYKDLSINPSQTKISDAIDFSKHLLSSIDDNKLSSDLNGLEKDLYDTNLGRIIGQAFNSYIVVETKNSLQILDQHALEERIIYERLLKSKYKAKTQRLLIGQSFKLTPKELNILKENDDTFKNMNFDFEIMSGGIVILNGIPDFIKKENLENIFLGVLNDIGEHGFKSSLTLEEIRNKIFAYMACRGAIKFGNKLSVFEINKLLNASVLDYSLTCPHGRPVVFELNLDELKKKYERN